CSPWRVCNASAVPPTTRGLRPEDCRCPDTERCWRYPDWRCVVGTPSTFPCHTRVPEASRRTALVLSPLSKVGLQVATHAHRLRVFRGPRSLGSYGHHCAGGERGGVSTWFQRTLRRLASGNLCRGRQGEGY